MNILHTVQRYAPDSGGSEEVVKQLSEYLVAFGHTVTVATGRSPNRTFRELNGVKIEEFSCRGNSVQGIYGEAERYKKFLANAEFDVMMNYAAQIWSSDLLFDLLPSLSMKKIFVPCGYSRLNDELFKSYFENMPGVLRRYDRVVYLSDDYIDTAFGERHGLTNGVVIPNGADRREFLEGRRGVFRAKYGLQDHTLVINVSNHSRLKGHAFFWNCAKALKNDEVDLVLIGNAYVPRFKKWASECYAQCRFNGARYHTPVLEDRPRTEVVEAFQDADVFLFGSKVECSPLVMFEAFASKTLFVTTDCGNVKDYRDVVCIVGDERDAVRVIRDYRVHPEKYAERIQRGYDHFLKHLNWEAIAKEYERLYEDVLENAS